MIFELKNVLCSFGGKRTWEGKGHETFFCYVDGCTGDIVMRAP